MSSDYRVSFAFTVLVIFSSSSAIKLNVPRVLLPFTQTVSANFTLEVTDGGCFTWYISRPEVAKLHLIDEESQGCSSKAIVTSTSRQTSRQSALIIITNELSKEVLHCDVTVASIYELEITTTTRELLLEDTPESFTLRAKDKEGDTFSSIDGLVFEWNLVTDTDTDDVIDAYKVLRFLKFSESLYKSSAAIYNLELQGLRGYTILVQGIKTGTAIARAALRDAAYPHSVETEVTLTVIANLILWPAHDVYVSVGSVWTYEIQLLQHGKSQKVLMPSDQYYLTVADEHVAMVNHDTCEVEAHALGYTTLLLKDRNVKRTKQPLRQQSVGIHVVEGHRLGFAVVPHQNWYLVEEREYTIVMNVFDIHNNELLITDNWRVAVEFPLQHFDVLSRSENGSYARVKTKKVGVTSFGAQVKGVVDSTGYLVKSDSTLEGKQDVEIVERVSLVPSDVLIPWHPRTKPSYKVNFKALGGGSYGFHWKCSNVSVAACDPNGSVTTKSIGSVNVTAFSMRNSYNYGLAKVNILLPETIEIVTPVTEVQLGTTVYIGVVLYALLDEANLVRKEFTNCTDYPFVINVSEGDRLQYVPTEDKVEFNSLMNGNVCAVLPFLAVGVGTTTVTITVEMDKGSFHGSVDISVYKKLRPVSPESLEESVLLAVGSSFRVVFSGGPKPLPLNSKTHFRDLGVEEKSIVSAALVDTTEIRNKDHHMFDVLCVAIGHTVVVFRVGNGNSSIAEAKVHVICDYPTAIRLYPQVPGSKEVPSICHSDEYSVVSHCYRDLDVLVSLHDEKGNRFHNFSSLNVVFGCSDSSLASLDASLVTVENKFSGYTTLNRSYTSLRPKNLEGVVQISATVSSYKEDMFLSLGISIVDLLDAPVLSSKLHIELVEDAVFVNSHFSVFNHPLNEVSVAVVKGSGHFDYDVKERGIAEITYDEKSKEFRVVPLFQGSFVLTLIDICLSSRSAATTSVRVSGLNSIDVRVMDKVSLGKEIVATVRILDQEGQVIPSAVFHLLEIHPRIASEIVSLRPSTVSRPVSDAFRFVVKGVKLGQTAIGFTVGRNLSSFGKLDAAVSSEELPIQVFSPLRLVPNNVTLIVGAVFQLSSIGGPHPQVHIEYEMKDTSVASVVSGGIVEGLKIGTTIVVGRAVGVDSDTGKRITYSKDEVFVHVVPLTGIRIKIPLTRIRTGAMIPIYAVGLNEEEIPFAFGSAIPTLTFAWSSSSKEVVRFERMFHQCGIHSSDANHFATRFFANQVGQALLSLKVYATSQDGQGGVLSQVSTGGTAAVLADEVEIHVYDELRLITPSLQSTEVLITPETELQLLTNKDRTSGVLYRITELSCSFPNGITVERNGLLRSGREECSATLLVTSFDEIVANRTLSFLVTVKRISYMMSVALDCSFQVKEKRLHLLPVGVEVPFSVQFYDNAGNVFIATNSRLEFRPSRFDLLRIVPGPKNDTFNVKVNNPGFTVVRVSDVENVGLEDYFLISSGEILNPSRPTVLLGNLICFTCFVTDSQGSWQSDDSTVVSISSSGLAVAKDVGSAVVIYNISKEFATRTEVSVLAVQSIEFDRSSSVRFLTNAHLDRVFHFPLILKGAIHHNRSDGQSTNIIGDHHCDSLEGRSLNAPFDCVLRFTSDSIEEPILEVFDVWKGFDVATGCVCVFCADDVDSAEVQFKRFVGRHECLLKAKDLSEPLARHWSTLVGDVEVSAVIQERTRQEYVASEKWKLPFYPAFRVFVSEVEVGDMQPVGSGFTLSATDAIFRHLSVKSNDSALIDILPAHTDPTTPTHHAFPVHMSDRFWRRVAAAGTSTVPQAHVEIFCSLTEQFVRVPIRFSILGDKLGKCVDDRESSGWSGHLRAVAESYSGFAIVIVSILGTLIAVFIGYHATVGQSGRSVRDQSATYLIDALGSPVLGSPGFNLNPNSTNQPHLWSVYEPVQGSPSFSRTPSPRNANRDRYVLT